MELYPRHFEALGNGRQTTMERLNEILGRTPRHYQQDTEQDNKRSSQFQRQGAPVSRHPLREQTARLEPGPRSAQSQYPHRIPPHIRSDQGQPMPQGPRQSDPSQRPETNMPVRAAVNQQYSQRQAHLDKPLEYEDFEPGRERSWRTPGTVSADSVTSYSRVSGADVREEWEDDTVDMRYGDWEDDGSEDYAQFSPQEPGTGANGKHLTSQATAGNSPTSPRDNRSF